MQDAERNYKIQGMHCTSCAMTIDWEIEDVPGVAEARTSYADAVTRVIFDPARVTDTDILDAIQRAGFEAVPATEGS